jgi:ATP-binding cassette subfamily B protein
MEESVNIPLGRYWRLLANYLKPQWLNVLLLAMLLLGQIGIQLVSPQIVRAFIDMVGAGCPPQELTSVALIFLGVAVVGQAMSIAVTYLSENVAWTATNALRLDLTLHCLRLDMSFHKTHTPGELIQRIDGDVNTLANFFSKMAIHLLGNALLALGVLILLFREDWRTGLVGTACALLTITALRAVHKPVVAAWRGSRQMEATLFGFVGEHLLGTEDTRANGAEPYVMDRLYRLMRDVTRAWLKAKMVQNLSDKIGWAIYFAAEVATLAIGAVLFLRGRMTIGTVYLMTSYVRQLQSPLDQMRRQIDDLQQASASIERIEALLNTQPTVIETPRTLLPAGALPVVLEGVSFYYDDGLSTNGESVLEDISFALEPGKVLGLLGRTGSGKTTLTRLLFRLYDPIEGAVHLGNVDLRDTSTDNLRQRVGLVTQDVQVFRATVRDNIALFSQRLSDEQILDALRELGLWQWYASLPEGLDTELRTGGQSLSAGEAQLLAFTRVYLKDPGLVILDEASSRLDPATEQMLEHAVDRLLHAPRRTAIIIAHRLSTVQRADEIMVLEDGHIREHGERQALATDPTSRFYSLLQTGLEEVLV